MPASGGTVLDTDDQPKPLARFTTGEVTVLSFMYTSCSDVCGCPFAPQMMEELKKSLDRETAPLSQVVPIDIRKLLIEQGISVN